MTVTLAEQTLAVVLLASLRTTAWVFVAPPFATAGLPRTVKVVFGVLLAVVVAPTIDAATPAVDDTGAFLTSAALQIGTGAALGFGTRLLFAAVESAGNLLDVVGGFSLAFAFDPMGNTNTSILGRFHGLLATVLLLVTPAHQVLLLGFLRCFDAVPLDGGLPADTLARAFTHGLTQLFLAALQIAGPMVVVLFLADIALGLLNRIAPQLNAFSLSFPLKIVMTLGLVGLTFRLLPDVVRGTAGQVVDLFDVVTG